MKTTEKHLEIAKLAVEFVLNAKDQSMWRELSEELLKVVSGMDSSLRSKITKLVEVILIAGSNNIAKFRLAYELLSDWETVGGFWWVVQEELLRHAALNAVKASFQKDLPKPAHEASDKLEEILPHPTIIGNDMLRAKVKTLHFELDILVERMAKSRSCWDIFQAYSDRYPLSMFSPWAVQWGKDLLLQAMPLCPELSHTQPATELTDTMGPPVMDDQQPVVTVNTAIQTEPMAEVEEDEDAGWVGCRGEPAAAAQNDFEMPTQITQEVSLLTPSKKRTIEEIAETPTSAPTAAGASQETTFMMVTPMKPETVTSVSSLHTSPSKKSDHSNRRSHSTSGSTITAAQNVNMDVEGSAVEVISTLTQTERILSESKLETVLRFIARVTGQLMHTLEPQTMDSTVETTVDDTVHTSDTEVEKDGQYW